MRSLRRFFLSLRDRLTSSDTLSVGGASILVGLLTGVGVWLFKLLYNLLHQFLFGTVAKFSSPAGIWLLLFIPAIGGILVGLIAQRFIRMEKIHGTAAIMQSVALSGGRLHYSKTPVNTLAAILSIGFGASVGPEDPSVQIGASLGSMFGQIFRVSEDRLRTLVAAGSASAIAAAFNAPIAGVFFALEIVLGEISGSAPGMILIASVTASAFTQAVSGSSPAFQIPTYMMKSFWEMPLYLLLGLLAGPISAAYVRLLYLMQDVSHRIKLQRWMITGLTGLVLGAVGILLPQVLSTGYGTIGEILNQNDIGIWMLVFLVIGKLVLTPLSISGGFFGGVFAPSLFIGAALGGGFGSLAVHFFPGMGITPAAFALVGMAAVLAGAVHAPLTAILLLFEMTNDYRIILPLMFAVAISLFISQRIQKDSVYSMGLARHGIRLDRGRDIEVLSAISVGEAMLAETLALNETDSVENAAEVLGRSKHHGLPVVDGFGRLIGIITLYDLEKATPGATVGETCSRKVEVAFPDESLSTALQRMSKRDVGRLPVVERENPRHLLGILRRSDVIHAYDLALTRRTSQRHREHAVKLDDVTPSVVDVLEVMVELGSPIAGKQMAEIAFPHESVVASVRRGQHVFIPRGDTTLLAGDTLVVVAEGEARAQVVQLCKPRLEV